MYLNKTDWENISNGASILSTGGGGDLKESSLIFSSVFNKNKLLELKKLDDFLPGDTICTAYIAGSIGSFEMSVKPLLLSFRIMEQTISRKIKGIIPVEIGPGDIAETVKIASLVNLPVVDGDIVGKRASPEIYLETITLKNLERTPLVATDSNKGILIIKNGMPSEIEEKVRNFARKSGGAAFVSGYPLKISELKSCIGAGTLSLCRKLGSAAKIKNSEWQDQFTKIVNGKKMFEGIIEKLDVKDDNGFLYGYIYLRSLKGLVAKIYFKNENLLLWINGKLKLSCPDLICIVDPETKTGIYNRDLKAGQQVLVLGVPGLKIWRSKKGLELFNPGTFGFNFKPKLLF